MTYSGGCYSPWITKYMNHISVIIVRKKNKNVLVDFIRFCCFAKFLSCPWEGMVDKGMHIEERIASTEPRKSV